MSYQDVTAENQVTGQLATPEAAGKGLLKNITEDGWAVLIGGLIIAGVLALSGFKITMPSYQWANAEELTGKVLSLKNIAAIWLSFP